MSKIIKKYILYGASFNPPHIGHFSAITQMLEDYDKVIVFPYPKKYHNGVEEKLPPMAQRMKMLEVFFADFFPQIVDRLILNNLSQKIKLKDKVHDGVLHTIDYLNYVKEMVPDDVHLSVCLGFEDQNKERKESFYKENEMTEKFGTFKLTEINQIQSDKLRTFFSNKKNVKTAKDEQYIRYAVGNSLAEFIFKNNLYGIQKKKRPQINTGEAINTVKSTLKKKF